MSWREDLAANISRALGASTEKDVPIVAAPGSDAYALGGAYNMTVAGKKKEYFEELRGWVGSAVTAIADEIAATELLLYRYGPEGVEEVDEHPIVDLLFRVNEYTTKFDHFWLTQSYLELCGEAPWFLEREGAEIKNIYLLRPDRLTLIPDKTKLVGGYEYQTPEGKRVTLKAEEIIFLKYPNPSRPFRGLGTLEQAAVTVDIDNYSEEWNKNFYKNSARPDAILTVNTPNMKEDQKKRLKDSLKEAYEGTKNAHKVMVLWGDMKFDKSSFNVKDMDFMEQQKFTRDKILGIFRVPKAIVAQTEGVNLASAETAQYVFARWTIKPKMERLVQQLNEFLLPMFPGTENMFIDYENPVQDDEQQKVAKLQSGLGSGWMTINEAREEMNLDPVDGGDILLVPFSVQPLISAVSPTDPAPAPTGDPSAGDPNAVPPENQPGDVPPAETPPADKPAADNAPAERMIINVKTKRTKGRPLHKFNRARIYEMKARGKKYFKLQKQKAEITKAVKDAIRAEWKKNPTQKIKINKTFEGNDVSSLRRVLSEEEIKIFWTTKNQIYLQYLKETRAAFTKIFQAQRRSILTKLRTKKEITFKDKANDLFELVKLDTPTETKRTLKLSFSIFESLFIDAGTRTYELLNLARDMEVTAAIRKHLTDEVSFSAVGHTGTTNDQIKAQLEQAFAKGESVNEMSNRIKTLFDAAEEFRADRIARTETLRYNTMASEQAFKDSGIVEGKQWVVNPNACVYCLEMEGKIVDLGSSFADKGDKVLDREIDYDTVLAPPLHPNCECDLVPIFKSNKDIAALAPKEQ